MIEQNVPIRNIEFYGYNETVITLEGIIFTILMAILVLWLNKKYIFFPVFAVALYLTFRQRIVIAGLDFDMIRIIIIASYIRFIIRSEYRLLRINRLDIIFLCYILINSIAYIALRKDSTALVNRLGFIFTSVGIYFIYRISISSFEDISRSIKGLLILSIPIAFAMILEQVTGRNLFAIFGGVPEYTFLREGRLRSQGAFSHPILAGSFGASLIPIAYYLRSGSRYNRILSIIGVVIGIIMVITSSSSGPLLAMLAAVLGIFMWHFRKYMKTIHWGGIVSLIILHFIMNGPVWALLNKVSVVGGSTGYHRYRLVDRAIRNFSEWALLGVESTAHWGWGLQDVTNMYIRVGVDGGFISLVLFVTILYMCFKIIGIKVRNLEGFVHLQKYVWAFGVILFTHAVSFLGVSYFGQMVIFFYFIIAIISTMSNLNVIELIAINNNSKRKEPFPSL